MRVELGIPPRLTAQDDSQPGLFSSLTVYIGGGNSEIFLVQQPKTTRTSLCSLPYLEDPEYFQIQKPIFVYGGELSEFFLNSKA